MSGHRPHNAGIEGSSPSISTIKSIIYTRLDVGYSVLQGKCR
jgi:hypothetical protein